MSPPAHAVDYRSKHIYLFVCVTDPQPATNGKECQAKPEMMNKNAPADQDDIWVEIRENSCHDE
jgi:hypothetical protein